jgi:hypothetical protein
MKITRLIGCGLLLAIALVFDGFANASQAAPPAVNKSQTPPPILILEDTFEPDDWTVTAEATGGATYTVTQQPIGGFASPPFRLMSHRLPPVTDSGLATIVVTHVYLGDSYDPAVQGAIRAIDYAEAGIILSFPFAEAFSTTQPVVAQGGRIYRSSKFLRFIAQNSSHAWETKSLSQLTAADFIAVGGSEEDHPDFSAGGGPIQFGFTRSNGRSSTLPPVPSDQDMVVDQGVDHLQIFVHRQANVDENLSPQAVDDVFILDGYKRSLPLLEIFDVVRNDSDPDQDSLEVIEVTEPTYGSAGSLSDHTIVYELDEARASDVFSYTVSDGALSSSAQVEVLIDCACTVLCLNQLELPPLVSLQASASVTDSIDLPLIYRVRDQVLKPTLDGRRYVAMYYSENTEILVNVLMHESLRTGAVATVELWQENLRSLVDGDGSAVITQAQVDALSSFLSDLSAVSSSELRQRIAAELARLGSLNDYVGLSVNEAKRQAIGDATIYLPITRSLQ